MDCAGRLFEVIPPWHEGICKDGDVDVDNINDLLVIGFNVVEMLLGIMVIAAIVFFLVGTVRLIGSSGKPEGIAAASKTIVNSVIGLAIGLSAGTITAFLSETANDAVGNGGDPDSLRGAIEIIIEIGAAVAIIMIVKAAIQYITGAGEPGKIAAAKNTIVWTVVGIILMVSSYTIISLVVKALRDGTF